MVTMTGPRSRGSPTPGSTTGSGHIPAGVRSSSSPWPRRQRQVNGSAIRTPAAAISRAVLTDRAVATCPHRVAPAAMEPKNTIIITARPLALTQLGRAVWAEILSVVSTLIQPAPPRNAAAMAAAGTATVDMTIMARAVTTTPAAATLLVSVFLRTAGKARAPVTAPAPIDPSRKP